MCLYTGILHCEHGTESAPQNFLTMVFKCCSLPSSSTPPSSSMRWLAGFQGFFLPLWCNVNYRIILTTPGHVASWSHFCVRLINTMHISCFLIPHCVYLSVRRFDGWFQHLSLFPRSFPAFLLPKEHSFLDRIKVKYISGWWTFVSGQVTPSRSR